MQLDLEANEVQVLIAVLGNQPTHTGVYPLAMKIQSQMQAQTTPQASPVVEAVEG